MSDRIPSLCHHRATGQAYVTLSGRELYLGKHGTPRSRQAYNRLIAEWLANGRQLSPQGDITLVEIIERYWQHVTSYHVKPDGSPTGEQSTIRTALKPLKRLYGRTPAASFGPLALKAIRLEMMKPQRETGADGQVIERPGWARKTVNKQVNRIKAMFKWAASEQLVKPEVYQALATVDGLRRGRSGARETEPVKPVPDAHVRAVLPFLSRQVRTMIELQLLTGARGGELFVMRPCDIDTSKPVWIYRPETHKTAHHGHSREIRLGRRAQALIAPFLADRPSTAYLFSPAEAETERRTARHAARKTPATCGNVPGSNRKATPKRQARDRYGSDSYARAIARACRKASVPHWHPHQLRHSASTRLRRDYGIEAAQVILGHKTMSVTEIYAEKNVALAERIMGEVG